MCSGGFHEPPKINSIISGRMMDLHLTISMVFSSRLLSTRARCWIGSWGSPTAFSVSSRSCTGVNFANSHTLSCGKNCKAHANTKWKERVKDWKKRKKILKKTRFKYTHQQHITSNRDVRTYLRWKEKVEGELGREDSIQVSEITCIRRSSTMLEFHNLFIFSAAVVYETRGIQFQIN